MSARAPRLAASLRHEYESLFQTCVVAAARQTEIDRVVGRLVRHRPRYEAAGATTTIPWQFVAIVHQLESGADFERHLHNGDSLSRRTVRVPKGRPRQGEPPFSWEVSAIDALRLRNIHRLREWSLPSLLYRLEAYNGFGYRMHHREVLSPYLWAGSNHYTRGKYVRDGVWNANAVSTQVGAAVLLRRLAELAHYAAPGARDSQAVVAFHPMRPRDRAMRDQALALQRWLNTHAGIFLREDGWPGPRTAAAYRRVTDTTLPGDPAADDATYPDV